MYIPIGGLELPGKLLKRLTEMTQVIVAENVNEVI